MRERMSVPFVGMVFAIGCGLMDPTLPASTLGLGAGATGTSSNGLNVAWVVDSSWDGGACVRCVARPP